MGACSLSVGVLAVAIGAIFGGAIGFVSGYFGGRVDGVSCADRRQTRVSGILAALVIRDGPGWRARQSHGGGRHRGVAALRARRAGQRDGQQARGLVEAARSWVSHGRIMFRHIVRRARSAWITLATLGWHCILATASAFRFWAWVLSRQRPEWGLMLSESEILAHRVVAGGVSRRVDHVDRAGDHVLGDGVRDALDPRLSMASTKATLYKVLGGQRPKGPRANCGAARLAALRGSLANVKKSREDFLRREPPQRRTGGPSGQSSGTPTCQRRSVLSRGKAVATRRRRGPSGGVHSLRMLMCLLHCSDRLAFRVFRLGSWWCSWACPCSGCSAARRARATSLPRSADPSFSKPCG